MTPNPASTRTRRQRGCDHIVGFCITALLRVEQARRLPCIVRPHQRSLAIRVLLI